MQAQAGTGSMSAVSHVCDTRKANMKEAVVIVYGGHLYWRAQFPKKKLSLVMQLVCSLNMVGLSI